MMSNGVDSLALKMSSPWLRKNRWNDFWFSGPHTRRFSSSRSVMSIETFHSHPSPLDITSMAYGSTCLSRFFWIKVSLSLSRNENWTYHNTAGRWNPNTIEEELIQKYCFTLSGDKYSAADFFTRSFKRTFSALASSRSCTTRKPLHLLLEKGFRGLPCGFFFLSWAKVQPQWFHHLWILPFGGGTATMNSSCQSLRLSIPL